MGHGLGSPAGNSTDNDTEWKGLTQNKTGEFRNGLQNLNLMSRLAKGRDIRQNVYYFVALYTHFALCFAINDSTSAEKRGIGFCNIYEGWSLDAKVTPN